MPKKKTKKKAAKKLFDGDLRVRMHQRELDIFYKKAERVTGRPYQMVLREFITAFNEDNLRIVPTEEHHTGKLYSKF